MCALSAVVARKSGPALATGCTMVLKPATAFSALALRELGEQERAVHRL